MGRAADDCGSLHLPLWPSVARRLPLTPGALKAMKSAPEDASELRLGRDGYCGRTLTPIDALRSQLVALPDLAKVMNNWQDVDSCFGVPDESARTAGRSGQWVCLRPRWIN